MTLTHLHLVYTKLFKNSFKLFNCNKLIFFFLIPLKSFKLFNCNKDCFKKNHTTYILSYLKVTIWRVLDFRNIIYLTFINELENQSEHCFISYSQINFKLY
jgi:hypothetical protein